jgi:hypothetical protein
VQVRYLGTNVEEERIALKIDNVARFRSRTEPNLNQYRVTRAQFLIGRTFRQRLQYGIDLQTGLGIRNINELLTCNSDVLPYNATTLRFSSVCQSLMSAVHDGLVERDAKRNRVYAVAISFLFVPLARLVAEYFV